MRITLNFLGGAGTVTGSRALLSVDKRKYLIDCGLFQGDKTLRLKNWEHLPVDPAALDAVILTHAHLDHTGYLPRLYKDGFRGPIYCSQGTADLARILLLDAAKLEEEAAHFANKTGYSHHRPAKPLFKTEDAEAVLANFRPQARDTWLEFDQQVHCRFVRSGHIIGSSYVQLALHNDRRTRTITFSGDVGHGRSLTLRPPLGFPDTDVLVLESTYGNRRHEVGDVTAAIAAVAKQTFAANGVLVIPAFAVGRSQEILFILKLLEDRGDIPAVPVILDSPMARAATEIFLSHPEDHNLEHAFVENGHPLFPSKYECSSTPDESMLACMREGPMVVISAAGMLTGGRILHHLKARLPDPNNCVLFAGYQAETTKGRFLQDNRETLATLRIHHQEIPIQARIETIQQLSSHADYADLTEMLRAMQAPPKTIILNHGSPEAMTAFATHLQQVFPRQKILSALTPQIFDLS